MKKAFFIAVLATFLVGKLSAQVKEQTAWLASFNNIKFSPNWGLHFDMQFRSADDREYVRNVLIRPGITYYLDQKNNITAGYLLNDTYTRLIGSADNRLTEHRIWQQFIHNQKITKRISLAHRFRLEQRFIERASDDVFAQRFRYFLRSVVPITKGDSTSFKKGLFVALQNELFLNVQHKSKLNNSFYDQNRAYAALGYRFSSKVDVEIGYLNQSIKGRLANTTNNALQLAMYTRF